MNAMRFVDTNVLLYGISSHPSEARKASIAGELLGAKDLCLSVQVLQEFYVQATRPSRADALSHKDAVALLDTWKRFPVLDLTVALLDAALVAKTRWRISYWDAAIVEAARALGCRTLLSEDLRAGQDFDGVRVVNPFA
jgi:predicted nucleic acid-binding protein